MRWCHELPFFEKFLRRGVIVGTGRNAELSRRCVHKKERGSVMALGIGKACMGAPLSERLVRTRHRGR